MDSMSSRERLLRVFRRQEVDRMPIRLWGVDPMFPEDRPSWQPLYELAEKYALDYIRSWSPSAEERDPPVVTSHTSERRQSDKLNMWEQESVIETPAGPISQVVYVPKDGSPGYVKKPYIESIEDANRWLSIPAPEPQFKADSYFEFERKSGDGALLMVGVGHAMYGVQALMGSETFGFWLMGERELLHEMVNKEFLSLERAIKRYLAQGVGDCFGWVGPELCIPPLASPRDFDEFVTAYDRRIIDLIHDAGKLVWVHCHGDMDPVLEGFIEMGVDCLNPIEPPPIGHLTLAEAKRRCGGRMSLDGGVQNGDFDLLQPDEMVQVVEETVAQGKPGGGFILCPTSTPTTWVELNDLHIANHRAFVETAARLAPYG